MSDKLKDIISQLEEMKKVFIAYSGGVDSTFLIKIAYDINWEINVYVQISQFPPGAKLGFILWGEETKGTIDELKQGESKKVHTNPLFGFAIVQGDIRSERSIKTTNNSILLGPFHI